jgi:hypothetical protein
MLMFSLLCKTDNLRIKFYMKTLLLCGFLLMQYGLTAQTVELDGYYSAFTNPSLEAEQIEFRGVDSFYFRKFGCGNDATGRGTCEIINNYLYLYFSRETAEVKTPATGKTTMGGRTPNGDYNVRLHIIEEKNGDAVPFALAVVKGKRQGAVANAAGEVLLKISQFIFPAVIEVSSTGYTRKDIMLPEAKSYEISVGLSVAGLQDKILSNGEIYKYELGEITDDYFEARPVGSKEKFRVYKKNNRIAIVCPD